MKMILFALAVLLTTFAGVWKMAQGEGQPQTPAEQWLSLSAESRSEYLHGYLLGFQRGKRAACSFYEQKITSQRPSKQVTHGKQPRQVCLDSVPEFKEPYFQVYGTQITKYFEKYPNDREAGVPNILDEMAVPPGLTDIDQIHRRLQ